MCNQKVFIIAEAGVNHNGDEVTALRLVEEAAEAGADAVKFQTFKADSLVTKSAETAEYQRENTGDDTQFSMLQNLELSEQAHRNISAHCKKYDIEFMSTAFDEDSLDFLCDLGIKKIKIPSGELTNTTLLSHAACRGLPMIISSGMATLEEVQEAVQVVREHTSALITVLHCTSNYPTRIQDVNLNAMVSMSEKLYTQVGYSDHTLSTVVPAASVALGATVIEKHITLDTTMQGPDHSASLNPEQFKEMVKGIREVEQCLGSAEKKPTESECKVRDVVRRSIVASRQIKIGSLISNEDIVLRRPGTGIQPKDLQNVIGKKAIAHIEQGDLLTWEVLEDA